MNGAPNSLEEYPSFENSLKAVMIRLSKNSYPQKHLTFIGNQYFDMKYDKAAVKWIKLYLTAALFFDIL